MLAHVGWKFIVICLMSYPELCGLDHPGASGVEVLFAECPTRSLAGVIILAQMGKYGLPNVLPVALRA